MRRAPNPSHESLAELAGQSLPWMEEPLRDSSSPFYRERAAHRSELSSSPRGPGRGQPPPPPRRRWDAGATSAHVLGVPRSPAPCSSSSASRPPAGRTPPRARGRHRGRRGRAAAASRRRRSAHGHRAPPRPVPAAACPLHGGGVRAGARRRPRGRLLKRPYAVSSPGQSRSAPRPPARSAASTWTRGVGGGDCMHVERPVEQDPGPRRSRILSGLLRLGRLVEPAGGGLLARRMEWRRGLPSLAKAAGGRGRPARLPRPAPSARRRRWRAEGPQHEHARPRRRCRREPESGRLPAATDRRSRTA